MGETTESSASASPGEPRTVEFGGLHFEISFRDGGAEGGATLRVFVRSEGAWAEVVRFDDFIHHPHFHAPASSPQIPFDRSQGEPLAWYVAQIRDHLPEWLERAGFKTVPQDVDLATVTRDAHLITQAMIDCVPPGFVRVPGVGLQRVEGSRT